MAKKKRDQAEWLYVLEVNPGRRIKVGQTTDLRARLVAHEANAEFGGGEITQIFTAICPLSRPAEFELIARLAARPGADLVLGREMFAGVPFRAAVDMAESIAREYRRKAAGEQQVRSLSLLPDCVSAFQGDERLHIASLRERLAEMYPGAYKHLTVLTLGGMLRDVGIQTRCMRLDGTVRRGLAGMRLRGVPTCGNRFSGMKPQLLLPLLH